MIPGGVNELLLRSAAAGGATAGRSVRFNSADSASLSKTFSSTGNRKTYTLSLWCKRSKIGGAELLLTRAGNPENTFRFNSDALELFQYSGGFTWQLVTTQLFRDPSAWYHILIAFDTTQATSSNRVKLYVNGTQVTAFSTASYPSLNFDGEINTNTAHEIGVGQFNGYLALVHFIDGQALTPSSFGETSATTGQWIAKTYSGSYGTNGFFLDFLDNSTAAALGYDAAGSNDWTVNNIAVWNGGSAMYSIGSFSNSLGYGFTTPGYLPAQSFDGSLTTFAGNNNGGGTNTWTAPAGITVTSTLRVYVATGAFPAGTTWAVNGTSQGSTSNGWLTASISTPYTLTSISNTLGSSATGAFFAAIEVNGTILVDKTNPGNDSLRDHPTSAGTSTGLGGEVSGNYATWNPLSDLANGATFANGNLEVTTISSGEQSIPSTLFVSSGKWYGEITVTTSSTCSVGLIPPSYLTGQQPGITADSYGYRNNGTKITNGSVTSYGASFTNGDVIGIALDLTGGTITFYKNGSSQGTAFTSVSGTLCLAFGDLASSASTSCIANFGQRAFAYTAPSGFSPLVDTLLPTPTIAKPNTVMDVALYTGNATARSITGLGFNPDVVWIKCRSAGQSHRIVDAVRGATYEIYPNLTNAEDVDSQGVTAFNSDGFSLGTSSTYNGSGNTYVAWTWDAGSSNATNTSGTITSTVRANISAGFSIVTWTGNGSPGTIGHGLGVAPQMIIIKNRSASSNWIVGHQYINSSPWNNWCLILNSTGAVSGAVAAWGGLGGFAPTSSLFGVGIDTNNNGNNFVAYCWTPVAGYSAFGSYTGNGSTDGPCIHTGFKPALIIIKRTNGANDWVMFDNKRLGYNPQTAILFPNGSFSESAADYMDLLANGFKIRLTSAEYNASGGTYIYAAFAEAPFPYARAR